MSYYIVSDVDIARDRRLFWLWHMDRGPVAKGMKRSDFGDWLREHYPDQWSEKRIRNASSFGCSSPAYLLEELLVLAGISYEQLWRMWT